MSHGRLLNVVLAMLIASHLSAHAEVPASLFAPSPEEESPTAGYRNERSTPRDSVLPVSPAIAPDHGERHDAVPVQLAKAILHRLGYHVGRLDDRFTAKFKAALFRYQRAHGLPSSGNLDELTLQSLRILRK